MNPISIRLLNQQLIAPQNSKPEDVVAIKISRDKPFD